jgi:hypothetical protein
MAHYVITGGTGFVGQALCRRLAARGVALTVLTRDPARAARCLPPGTRSVSQLADLPANESVDAVINLAGEPIAEGRWSTARKRRLEESRIALTQALVRWMAQAAPRRVDQRIGDRLRRPGRCAGHQASAPPPSTPTNCAPRGSRPRSRRAHGIRTAVLRIGLVLGPGGGSRAHAAAVSPRARQAHRAQAGNG